MSTDSNQNPRALARGVVKNNKAEQPAQQQATEPNAVLVEGFGRVAMRKLNDLHEKGYAINGVSIATMSEAGETNRGAVTTGGMVLWWPAQQAAGPVGEGSERQFALREAHRNHLAEQYFKARPQIDFLGNRRLFESGFDRGWDAKQIPTQQPLTSWQRRQIIMSVKTVGEAIDMVEAIHNITASTIPAPQLEAAQALIDHQAAQALGKEGASA